MSQRRQKRPSRSERHRRRLPPPRKSTADLTVRLPERRTEPETVIAHLGPTNSGKTHDALRFLVETGRGIYAAPLRMLALLQAESRLVDFLMEDVQGYTDAQIGQAVREVHKKARAALLQHATIEPVLKGTEGDTTTVPKGFDPSAIRVVGNIGAGGKVKRLLAVAQAYRRAQHPLLDGRPQFLPEFASATINLLTLRFREGYRGAGEDAPGVVRVQPHELPLLRSQRPGPLPDAGRDRHAAKVMKNPGAINDRRIGR